MEDWQALGRAVYRGRVKAGFRDTALWAARIGRSTRVLLGLERGEPTGRRTLLMIEEALDWPAGWCDLILAGEQFGPPDASPRAETGGSVGSAGDDLPLFRYQRPPGLTDREWDDLRRQHADYWDFLVERAARDR
jgi:hypothetical protein